MELRERVDFVIGVDSHRDRHAVALCDRHGARLHAVGVAADPFGYRDAFEAAVEHCPGRRIWAVEGTGSYGAGLAAYLEGQGEWVVEIDHPTRRRAGGKSDALDAVRAAREALARDRLTVPRARGERAAIRSFLVCRETGVVARTKAIQLLRALLLTAPEPLRGQLRGLNTPDLLAACSRLRGLGSQSLEHRATAVALRSTARRALALEAEALEMEALLAALVGQVAPQLLDEMGVGVVTAAQLVVSWSHQGRVRSEAAFASLAGVSPLPASSGDVVRHRLNRNGDRKLNRAMHTIVITRMAHDPETRAYVAKRTADGKSRGEIRRCLKRFVARRMYALLEAGPGGLERSERGPEGVGSLRPVGEILTRLKEVPAGA